MTAISIAVGIPLIPSQRTSRKEVEGGLLSSFKREQFEMQEVSELAVVTVLVRYKSVYIKQCIFLQVEIGESWKKNPSYSEQVREIQRLGKEGWVKWKIKRKQLRQKYTPSDFQRDGEINDSDTEMQT